MRGEREGGREGSVRSLSLSLLRCKSVSGGRLFTFFVFVFFFLYPRPLFFLSKKGGGALLSLLLLPRSLLSHLETSYSPVSSIPMSVPAPNELAARLVALEAENKELRAQVSGEREIEAREASDRFRFGL